MFSLADFRKPPSCALGDGRVSTSPYHVGSGVSCRPESLQAGQQRTSMSCGFGFRQTRTRNISAHRLVPADHEVRQCDPEGPEIAKSGVVQYARRQGSRFLAGTAHSCCNKYNGSNDLWQQSRLRCVANLLPSVEPGPKSAPYPRVSELVSSRPRWSDQRFFCHLTYSTVREAMAHAEESCVSVRSGGIEPREPQA